MILDKRSEFCDATALSTGGAGTYLLGNQVDLGVARDIGNGQPVYLVITVATGIEVASSTGTVQFTLASDATAAVATDGSATVHVVSPAFATSATTDTTTLKAGTVLFAIPLPLEGNAYEKFLGVLQTTGSTAISAGAIDASITLDVQAWKAYDNAI
tara:strand:- start:4065 stop:4535 length:471 start_codon:yes stop_codon:yes gene_type:complete